MSSSNDTSLDSNATSSTPVDSLESSLISTKPNDTSLDPNATSSTPVDSLESSLISTKPNDTSLDPNDSSSTSPPPPPPEPDDFSMALSEGDAPKPSTSNSPSQQVSPTDNDIGSPSSSPTLTSDPVDTTPAPTGSSNSNSSDENSAPPPPPPPEASKSPPPPPPPHSHPPPPPPPSPPPPVQPPEIDSAELPSSPPPPPPPPSPPKKDPTDSANNDTVPGPDTSKEAPSSKPTDPAPPLAKPDSISSPGETSATKRTPSPPQGISNQPLESSNVLPPPPTPTPTTSPSTSTSARTPKNSPPSTDSTTKTTTTTVRSPSGQSNAPSSGSSSQTNVVVGAALAGVFVILLVAVFFAFKRKKKTQGDLYTGPYLPPNNFVVKSDGNYYPHQHMGNSGSVEGFYTQVPHTPIGNSFGSQKGTQNSSSGTDSGVINCAKSFFSYEELMEITSGFSRQNILGEGGFGCVFKGWLPDGKPVAVKQLKAGSGQGEREFKAEVEIISRVHHRYLVSLVGYCVSENHRLLIYEFVSNKTLEYHLHGGNGVPVLEWCNRLKIALGSAKGLAYLHEDCHPRIIHRDIKSANILLDDAFEAKVADFGLAKLTNDAHTHVSTRVMGTFGYMAPEYASSGKLTDRSDVFSFGVVLLELITGRKPVDPTQPLGDESLVEWARPLLLRALETGVFDGLIDRRLEKRYVESEVFRMIEAAAACVRHSAPKRPRMIQVVRALDIESDVSDLSNGVKYGQSTAYNSGQYTEDISNFRRMALGDSYEFDIYSSSEFNSRETAASHESWRFQNNSSGESETRAFNGRSGVPHGRQF